MWENLKSKMEKTKTWHFEIVHYMPFPRTLSLINTWTQVLQKWAAVHTSRFDGWHNHDSLGRVWGGGRWSTTVLIIWYSRQTSLFRLWKGINDALTTAQRWLSSGSGHPLFHNFTFTETQPSWYMRICSVLERKQELLRSLQLKKLELPPLRALTSDLLTLSSSSTRWEQYYLSVRGFL